MENNRETRLFDLFNPKISTIVFFSWVLVFYSVFCHIYRWIFRIQKKEDDEWHKELKEFTEAYRAGLDAEFKEYCDEIDKEKRDKEEKEIKRLEELEMRKYRNRKREEEISDQMSMLRKWSC